MPGSQSSTRVRPPVRRPDLVTATAVALTSVFLCINTYHFIITLLKGAQ